MIFFFAICIQSVNKDLAGFVFVSEGPGQEIEGRFPFARFNAHIEYGHNKVEILKKKNVFHFMVKEPEAEKLAS